MAYKAIKPVHFAREYSIGEAVPDVVVDPARAPKLQAMGLILPVPDTPKAPPAKEAAPDHEATGAAEKRKAAQK